MAIFGAHVSSAGSLLKTFDRAEEIGAETFQFFLTSPRAWRWKRPEEDVVERFCYLLRDYGGPVVVHAPYLINPASGNGELRRRSVEVLVEELSFCESVGIPYYNLHPGTAKGISEEIAIRNIVLSLREAVERSGLRNTTILLENTSGERGDIGKSLEELAQIIEGTGYERMGVCLDTCHTFASGYEINDGDGFSRFLEELDNTVGIYSVKIVHANDSKVPLGGKRDRHEHIGKGYIGMEGFMNMLSEPYLGSLPYIIETPKEGDMDRVNLSVLRGIEASLRV